MAYIKKFDRAINTICECIEKGGKDATIVIDGTKYEAKVWNKFPVCVQDICVDNFVLIKNADDVAVFGCDFDDDKTMTTSKETFNRRWRDLKKMRSNSVEYVARILNNLENVLKVKNIKKESTEDNVQ